VRAADGFEVVTAAGVLRARRVVLATGGRSLPKSGSDGAGYEFARAFGHTIVPTTPALVPLVLEPSSMHRALAGVSHDVELSVWIDDAVAERLAGSLLWTHFGISGPVALNASRHWLRAQVEGRPASITINFCPGRSFAAVDERLREAAAASPRATALAFVSRLMPASVAGQIVDQLGLGAVTLAHLPRDARRRLAHALVEFPLPVAGSRGYTFAEATAGGVALDEIDPGTLESRVCPGLYLVGEILDVDGRIGGFNFHWAWATGFAAGRALG
jgi:predicted Rossmann fold flavoprotein